MVAVIELYDTMFLAIKRPSRVSFPLDAAVDAVLDMPIVADSPGEDSATLDPLMRAATLYRASCLCSASHCSSP